MASLRFCDFNFGFHTFELVKIIICDLCILNVNKIFKLQLFLIAFYRSDDDTGTCRNMLKKEIKDLI